MVFILHVKGATPARRSFMLVTNHTTSQRNAFAMQTMRRATGAKITVQNAANTLTTANVTKRTKKW